MMIQYDSDLVEFATLPPWPLIFQGRSVQFVNPQARVELMFSMFFLCCFMCIWIWTCLNVFRHYSPLIFRRIMRKQSVDSPILFLEWKFEFGIPRGCWPERPLPSYCCKFLHFAWLEHPSSRGVCFFCFTVTLSNRPPQCRHQLQT